MCFSFSWPPQACRESSVASQEGLKSCVGLGCNSLCPAPSIGDAAGKKHANLFESRRSEAKAGRVSAGRVDDAQDQAGHGRLLLVRFLPRGRK